MFNAQFSIKPLGYNLHFNNRYNDLKLSDFLEGFFVSRNGAPETPGDATQEC